MMLATLITNFLFAVSSASTNGTAHGFLVGRPMRFDGIGYTQTVVCVNSVTPQQERDSAVMTWYDADGNARDGRLACPHRKPLNGSRKPPLHEWDPEVGHPALMFRPFAVSGDRRAEDCRGASVFAERVVIDLSGRVVSRDRVGLGLRCPDGRSFNRVWCPGYGEYLEAVLPLD